MAPTISTPQHGPWRPGTRVAHAIVVAAASVGVVIGLAAAVLWFHYGTAVFFEMIASGLSACF
jgi:hypothetical protein